MLKTVIIGENAIDPSTWETFHTDDVLKLLFDHFETFPDTARIYHEHIAETCDVTPSDENTIEKLGEMDGTFYVVVYPGDPVTIIIAIVAIIAIAAATYFAKQNVPSPSLRNNQSESPNNELSDRQNRPRPNARIPDIVGTVRSTPDLLAVPYKVFENNQEVEYSFMSIGRGEYEVLSGDVRDDTTTLSEIAGATVEIFKPFTSPNSGDAPQLRIGTEIDEPVFSPSRSSAVNGQVLRAPNSNSVSGKSNILFKSPDEIKVFSFFGVTTDFTDFFSASDVLTISDAEYTGEILGTSVSENPSVLFNSSGQIEFETASTASFEIGDVVTITNAIFTTAVTDDTLTVSLSGDVGVETEVDTVVDFTLETVDTTVTTTVDNTLAVTSDIVITTGTLTIDLSGTYVISAKTSSTLTLSSPESVNTDWDLIAGNFDSNKTDNKVCNLSTPSGQVTVDLSGEYTILSVSADTIVLANPALVNSDWALLSGFPLSQTGLISPVLETSGSKWIGPFTLADSDIESVFSNFVALNGVYKDDGKQQTRFDVAVQIELTPIDISDVEIGPSEFFNGIIEGSSTSKSTKAVTIRAVPTFTGRCKVRGRRVTDSDLNFEGSVVDEIKWRDVYGMAAVSQTEFGNITTVHSVTYATSGALSVKDRKLNMLVSRKLAGVKKTVSDFTIDEDGYYAHEGATLSVSSGKLEVSNSTGTEYGALIDLSTFEEGAKVEIVFTISNIQSLTTSIEVGLRGGGVSWASNTTEIGQGTFTANLIATRAANDSALLFLADQAGGSFDLSDVTIYVQTNQLEATSNAARIITAMALDPSVGNRSISEIDYKNIYETIEEIQAYFETDLAGEFNYTFDNDNISSEETIATIASAVYSNAYRRGSEIKLSFEKETDDSTLLFNHRNKLPGSETRTVGFGNQDDKDGIEYEYIDPIDDALVTFYLPSDKSAVNPRKIESVGIRNKIQAHFHAHRYFNKLLHQNVATEFDATQEADLLILSDRILVADNTRPDTQDGFIISQSGLEIELSQEITFEVAETYVIFLQHIDGTVESMSVLEGADSRHVILSQAPNAPLSLEVDASVTSLFQIVADSSEREHAFLVTEKESLDNFTSTIRAINYDSAYYAQDKDFANGIILENGNEV